MNYGGHFDIPSKKEEIDKLTHQTEDSNFWNDREKAESTLNELKSLKELVNSIESLKVEIESTIEVIKLLEVEPDNNLYEEIKETTKEIENKVDKLNLLLMLNGPYVI